MYELSFNLAVIGANKVWKAASFFHLTGLLTYLRVQAHHSCNCMCGLHQASLEFSLCSVHYPLIVMLARTSCLVVASNLLLSLQCSLPSPYNGTNDILLGGCCVIPPYCCSDPCMVMAKHICIKPPYTFCYAHCPRQAMKRIASCPGLHQTSLLYRFVWMVQRALSCYAASNLSTRGFCIQVLKTGLAFSGLGSPSSDIYPNDKTYCHKCGCSESGPILNFPNQRFQQTGETRLRAT